MTDDLPVLMARHSSHVATVTARMSRLRRCIDRRVIAGIDDRMHRRFERELLRIQFIIDQSEGLAETIHELIQNGG